MTPEEEQELRELQDPDAWDWEHGELHAPVTNAGAVVSVRFTRDEFDRVAAAAERIGLKLTQFIHDAALAHVEPRPAER
jgi:hypothetical protein